MLVTARSLAEYRAMFGLDDPAPAGTVLDACAGGSSFVAEVRDGGGHAVAVDPAYGLPRSELVDVVTASLESVNQIIVDNDDHFVWDWYGSRQRRDEIRRAAGHRFLADVRQRPTSYVAAALPHLPFADASFDLVLSSHLLFTWSDVFDASWHEAALREMLRVARSEVRVFPLVVQGSGDPVPFLPRLISQLTELAHSVELRRVPYEFQRGANTMLVVSAAP